MKNGFSLLIRDIYGVDWWKKRGSNISWHFLFKRLPLSVLGGGRSNGCVK
jgi:hypothetical protein